MSVDTIQPAPVVFITTLLTSWRHVSISEDDEAVKRNHPSSYIWNSLVMKHDLVLFLRVTAADKLVKFPVFCYNIQIQKELKLIYSSEFKDFDIYRHNS